MTLTDVTLHEKNENVTYVHFKWSGYPFGVQVYWQHDVLVRFRHYWDEKITCPFCGKTTFGLCKGVIEHADAVIGLLKDVLHSPDLRLRVLTETSINIDDPPLLVSHDPRQPLMIEEAKKRLLFFQEIAKTSGQSVMAIHDGLDFIVLGDAEFQQPIQVNLDGSTKPFHPAGLMDPYVQTPGNSFFSPYFTEK